MREPETDAVGREAPAVWVVILDFRTGPILFDCVRTFAAVEYPNLRIVLVDNASNDGYAAEAARRFPSVRLLTMNSNTGYCGGNNAGIELALESGAEYVLVVNPDTQVLDPGFIGELVRAMQRHPDAGIVGPLVHFRERGVLQNTNCRLPFFGRKLRRALGRGRDSRDPRAVRPEQDVRVEVLNGVCVLLRRRMLLDRGAYDPDIFMYGEDWDLTLRVAPHGWASYQVPVDGIVHLQKADGYDFLSLTNFLLKRNAPYVLLKHGYAGDALMVALGGWMLSFVRTVRALLTGRDARSHVDFLGRLSRAYLRVFSGRTAHPDFGPPVTQWQKP